MAIDIWLQITASVFFKKKLNRSTILKPIYQQLAFLPNILQEVKVIKNIYFLLECIQHATPNYQHLV